MDNLEKVTVIVPCRNEEKFISLCIESIINNGYPKELLEILIVDGMSTDGTLSVIEKYVTEYPLCIRRLLNKKIIIPAALNLGIENATGNIILLMSSHATYEPNYIEECVKYMKTNRADNVGGAWRVISRDKTLMGNSITHVLTCRFGVGNAYYRIEGIKEPMWVDATRWDYSMKILRGVKI